MLICALILTVLGGYRQVYAKYVDMTWPYVMGGIPYYPTVKADKYQYKLTVEQAGPLPKVPW